MLSHRSLPSARGGCLEAAWRVWFLLYKGILLVLRGAYPLYAMLARLRGIESLELRQRLGSVASPPVQGPWIQAASVGEAGIAANLIWALRARIGPLPFYLTTTTRTGQALARRLEDAGTRVGYFPLDFPGAVRRAMDGVRPSALILVETEIWPNLLSEAARRSIPVIIVNGRISDRAERRYRIVAPLLAQALGQVSLACVQSGLDRDRYARLGVPAERIRVTGNMKFAGTSAGRDPAPLLAELGMLPSDELWLAGSTADGEEEAVLAAYRRLPPPGTGRRVLVLAPRRPERFELVGRLLDQSGFTWSRRSAPKAGRPELILLDTLGELSTLYGAATVAFVGGSLAPIGGHNILEPAACGVAPIFGPYIQNVRDIAARLLEAGGAFQVPTPEALGTLFVRLAGDPEARVEAGARALRVMRDNAGAMDMTVKEIVPFLSAPAAARA